MLALVSVVQLVGVMFCATKGQFLFLVRAQTISVSLSPFHYL